MMRTDCPFDLVLKCATLSQMKCSKIDSDFNLTAKSIKPAVFVKGSIEDAFIIMKFYFDFL